MDQLLKDFLGVWDASGTGKALLLAILIVLVGVLIVLYRYLQVARETRKAAAGVQEKKIAAEQEEKRADSAILTQVIGLFASFDTTLKAYAEATRVQTAAIQSGFSGTPAAVAAEVLPPIKAVGASLDIYADRNLKATTDMAADLSKQIGGLSDLFISKLPEALRGELKPVQELLMTVKDAAIAGKLKAEAALKAAEENKAVSDAVLHSVQRSEEQFVRTLSTMAASNTVKFTPAETAALEAEAAARNSAPTPAAIDPKPPTGSKPSGTTPTASTNGNHNTPKT